MIIALLISKFHRPLAGLKSRPNRGLRAGSKLALIRFVFLLPPSSKISISPCYYWLCVHFRVRQIGFVLQNRALSIVLWDLSFGTHSCYFGF